MKKENNYFLYFFIFFFFIILFNSNSFSIENKRFLSLKSNKVNLRQGPSFDYPIKLVYKKKYLPVLIIDKSETWRQIKDFQNNTGWIHITQLSKKKTAINIKKNSILYKKSTIYSKPIAKLEVGRLVLIKKCEIKWCKISTGDFNGSIIKSFLWGKIN